MYWQRVPGFFDFEAVYDAAVASAPPNAVLVEVGTLFGRSALYMAARIKAMGRHDLKFYVVDKFEPWPQMENIKGMIADSCAGHGGIWETFKYHLHQSGLQDIVNVVRADSLAASLLFKENRPWFVFIDANHTYQDVKCEILAWRHVLTTPGILAGHDYPWEGVKQAVNEVLGVPEVNHNSWVVSL